MKRRAGISWISLSMLLLAPTWCSAETIHGCVRLQDGLLRIVPGPEACVKDERPLSWSREGAKESPGKQGDQGEAGPQISAGRVAAPPLRTWIESVTGMEFIWVPGGCFQMGSPPSEAGRDDDESPQHEVCVGGFWMGRTEVTNAHYRRFQSAHDSGRYQGESLNGDDQPVVNLSRGEALEYARWLGERTGGAFRLPTEAEWEYAARGGTTSARYWGDDPLQACSHANVADRAGNRQLGPWTIHECDDGYAVAAPVGKFPPNRYGLYDMLGNVGEFCADTYGEKYYAESPRDNPAGPTVGRSFVNRGGSWFNEPGQVRSAYRNGRSISFRIFNLGFRLVAAPGRLP